MDFLTNIFENQGKINERILPMITEIIKNEATNPVQKKENEYLRTQWFVQFAMRMNVEQAKLMQSVDWDLSIDDFKSRLWRTKQTGQKNEWGDVKDGLANMMACLASMCLIAKVQPHELFQLYFEKNAITEDANQDYYKTKNDSDQLNFQNFLNQE
jgi:hypothetical protein